MASVGYSTLRALPSYGSHSSLISSTSSKNSSVCAINQADFTAPSFHQSEGRVRPLQQGIRFGENRKRSSSVVRLDAANNIGAVNKVSPAVEKVELGKSGLEVPVIGIGAWSWGDKFFWNDGEWNDRKVSDAREAYNASIETGLAFFDTAEVYGTKQFGQEDSESLLGRYIRQQEKATERPIVATKFAPLPWRLGRGAVVSALRDSLSRLGLSSVDLYQIHWPGLWANEEYIDGLAECVKLGLTKAVGVSNFKEDRLRSAHAQLAKRGVPLASNQVHYNILYRIPEENGVKKACEDLNVTLIAYSPLAQGVLSGKYSATNPPTGPRGVSYSTEFLTKAEPLFGRLAEIGEKYGGKTKVQVALNWLVSQGNIVPIPGAKSRSQAEEFAGALGWELEEEEIEELRNLAKRVPVINGFPAERF